MPTPQAGDRVIVATATALHTAHVTSVVPMPGGPIVNCRTDHTLEDVAVPLAATYPPPVALGFVPPYWGPLA